MYSDGMLGNQALVTIIGTLVTGVFNYIRSSNSPSYTLKSILGPTYGYIYPEVESNASEALLAFMSQAQGFDISKFEKD